MPIRGLEKKSGADAWEAEPEGRFVCLHFANEEIWGFEVKLLTPSTQGLRE